jgi:hypothetical protein
MEAQSRPGKLALAAVGCLALLATLLLVLGSGSGRASPALHKAEDTDRACRGIRHNKDCTTQVSVRCPRACASLVVPTEGLAASTEGLAANRTALGDQFSNACPAQNDAFACPSGAVAMWTSRAYRGHSNPPGVPSGMVLPMGARLCLQACFSGAFVQQYAHVSCLQQDSNCNSYITVAGRTFVLPLGRAHSRGYCCSEGYGVFMEEVGDDTFAYVNRDPAAEDDAKLK